MFGLGEKELSVEELMSLFDDDSQEPTPPAKDDNATEPPAEGEKDDKKPDDVTQTKAFAHRLKESTDKARADERDKIAKSLGYDSYDDMQKKRETELINNKGLDAEEVQPIVEELVQQRLNSDPRMKELESLREQRLKEFAKTELAEITKLTDGEITSLAQLPKEVVELWKTEGSLKSAYLKLEGEKLINKVRSEQSKGSTGHMGQIGGGGNPKPSNTRPLTDEEKKMWRFFDPSLSEEDLNKKTVEK